VGVKTVKEIQELFDIEQVLAKTMVADPVAVTNGELDPRVVSGVRVLDGKVVDWDTLIDLDKFNLTDCSLCVLGQTHGDYFTGLTSLWPRGEGRGDGEIARLGSQHGFSADGDDDYEQLERDWRKGISERQTLRAARNA